MRDCIWMPQGSYPCDKYSDNSSFKVQRSNKEETKRKKYEKYSTKIHFLNFLDRKMTNK